MVDDVTWKEFGSLSPGVKGRQTSREEGSHENMVRATLRLHDGLTRGRYNQIANFVLAQSEINIGIGDRDPKTYFSELADQCNGGAKKYGGITTIEEMRANLRMSCLPERMLDGEIPSFDDFLEQRRKLMAQKIKTYFEGL